MWYGSLKGIAVHSNVARSIGLAFVWTTRRSTGSRTISTEALERRCSERCWSRWATRAGAPSRATGREPFGATCGPATRLKVRTRTADRPEVNERRQGRGEGSIARQGTGLPLRPAEGVARNPRFCPTGNPRFYPGATSVCFRGGLGGLSAHVQATNSSASSRTRADDSERRKRPCAICAATILLAASRHAVLTSSIFGPIKFPSRPTEEIPGS